MYHVSIRGIALGLSLLLLPNAVQAQAPGPDTRIGLALSGGGAKGMAHVGVLKVLEEVGLPIDYIAGTSMGSVVGGLYAAGLTTEQLEHLALETDWNELFSDGPDRRLLSMEEKRRDGRYIVSLPLRNRRLGLPTGLIEGQRISMMLNRLTWPVYDIRAFKDLPIPFVSIATDIETGKAITLAAGHLPRAIQASMTIPTALAPVEIENRLLVDGGVARNLPAEDARNMGADYVICVDVSAPLETRENLNSLAAILNQTIGFGVWTSIDAQRARCDLLILPDIAEYSTLAFDKAAELIELGITATRAHLDTLHTLAQAVNRPPAPRTLPSLIVPDSVRIHSVEVIGSDPANEAVILNQIEFTPPTWLTLDALEAEVSRIYSTQYFKQVTYQLEPDSLGAKLTFQVVERQENQVQLGFRYDQRREAAFLFNARFRNILTPGAQAGVELILGERFGLAADYFLPLGLRKQYGLLGIADYTNRSFEVFENGDRFAELRFRQFSLDVTAGSYLSDYGIYAGGLRFEQALISPRIAPPDFSQFRNQGITLMMPVARVWFDTQDRTIFPTQGHYLYIESVGAHRNFGSDVSMSQHRLIWRSALPIRPRWTLIPDVELGISIGEVPTHRTLTLGGLNQTVFESGRFYGLKPDEGAGKFIKKMGAGLQFALTPSQYLALSGNIGNANDTWEWDLAAESFVWGIGATIGLLTPIGPAEFTLAHSSANNILYDINVGFRF